MSQARCLHHLGIHHRIGGISPHQATKNQVGNSRQGRLKNTAVELERADFEGSGEVQGSVGTRGLGDGGTGRRGDEETRGLFNSIHYPLSTNHQNPKKSPHPVEFNITKVIINYLSCLSVLSFSYSGGTLDIKTPLNRRETRACESRNYQLSILE